MTLPSTNTADALRTALNDRDREQKASKQTPTDVPTPATAVEDTNDVIAALYGHPAAHAITVTPATNGYVTVTTSADTLTAHAFFIVLDDGETPHLRFYTRQPATRLDRLRFRISRKRAMNLLSGRADRACYHDF